MSNSNILKIGSLLNKFPNNGSKIELSQELKDALVGVWLAYGKSNDSTDRNIIKNKIKDKGGDFVISNAAYKLNSGYGKYEEDFTDWRIYPNIKVTDNVITTNGNFNSTWFIYKHSSESKINEMNIKVSGIPKGGKILYFYISDETDNLPIKYTIPKDGIYHLPESKINNNRVSVGFTVESRYDWNNIRIEQIPSFEGAFVTDGKDDFITSTKTVQEMLGGSNEITVVSMIHLVQTPAASSEKAYTNQIRTGQNYLRNYVTDNGKTGIYGYTCKGNNVSVINNILGDKNDYTVENKSWNNLAKFSVIGYEDNGTINELDQVAWYWTIIANKVLTTDQINQVIAYFNLDRTLKPDMLCNITKQGITNDNHADFNDKLIDYSGNGRDIQMNNLAWKGGSGIAAKPFETIKDYTIVSDEARQKLTIYNEFSYKVKSNTPNHYWTVQSIIKDNTSYQVTIITDKDCYWINSTAFTNNEGNKESIRKEYPVKANTPTQVTICGLNEFEYPEDIEPTTAVSYVNLNYAGEVTVTFIPSCKGGLLLDGVNDFGKVTGLPIYKDYTVVADRELFNAIGCVLSNDNPGAFIFETSSASVYNFGEATTSLTIPTDKQIRYQTKYSYNGQNISIGAVKEGTSNMWLGTIRDNDARFRSAAIYSLMTFPYSMSEFLIERQLKKHKLGTLYPNMVEFRPVIKANANYKITYYQIDSTNTWKSIKVGDYIVIGAKLAFQITFDNDASELKEVVSPQLSGIIVEKRPSNPGYNIYSYITSKSPQKINITIDEYIRYEDIVQPYPVLLRFNDENGNEVSWGGKVKLGSSITRIGSFNDCNLLKGIYTVSNAKLNGNPLPSTPHVVERQMVFTCTATYLLDDNEPKCILSPKRLKLANSSYKYLGYIPDISGNGNNGVFTNFAFSGMSGADGYGTNLGNWNVNSSNYGKIKTRKINYLEYEVISESKYLLFYNIKVKNETFIIYADIDTHISYLNDSKYEFLVNIPAKVPTKVICPKVGTILLISDEMPTIGNIITVQQEGLYDGSICFDGVDDFVTIPTTVGGKQVLMKVNWNSYIGRGLLYDQRGYLNEFAIYNRDLDSSDNHVFAYQARNNGQTYIDGILNNNIDVSELRNITHNITITNELSAGVNTSSPVIGSNRLHNDFFANMALYDFMLFDNISTDDKIKELNEYVGTEGNFVEWNPTITTNISSTYAITPNIRKSDGIIVKLVKGNIYSTSITGNLVLDIVPPNKDLDEVTNVIIDGKSYTPIKYQYADYYRVEIPLIFPQEINVIIDEYITYETIEQPYPIFLNYIDKETNKAYTWGDKVKVDSILKISGYKNLFENGDTSLGGSNGYSVNGSSELIALGTLLTSEILVNKINTGVRSSVIWNLNTPKPLFAYDPSIINNVGLKNLGYLPDITGQGRHLLLNEFAYEGMSGINGYPVVFGENKTWEAQGTKDGDKYYIYTSSANKFDITQIKISSSLFYTYIKRNGELTSGNKDISSFKLKVTGLESTNLLLRYNYLNSANATTRSISDITSDGIHELPKSFASDGSLTDDNFWIGLSFIRKSSEIPDVVKNVNITIEVLPNYEGSLYFDGVNDYGTVSNLPSQYIKTLLMKVNWMKDSPMLLYDQRGENYFGILITQKSDVNNTKIAYQARNPNGKTYIDGIENNYIETYTLKDITHNITITNSNVNTIVTPVIGSNSNHSANFAQMAMYKVMGLPEIPSDEEIKTLNNWAGIEAKVELPSYYWDAYGKTNLDADRGYIKDQVSLQLNNDNTNNNSLENFNFGYEGMSGYNGYPVVFGANKTWENFSSVYSYTSDVTSTTIHITRVKNAGTGLLFSYVKKDGALTNIREIPAFRVTVKGLEGNSKFGYRYLATEDATVETLVYLGNGTHELSKSFTPTEALLDLTRNAWVGIFITPMVEGEVVFDCDITIEVLPEYENGLAYDGVSDFSQNTEIEVVEDFTFLVKGSLLKGLTGSGGCIARKGDKKHYDTGGYAFIYCFDSPIESYRNSYYSFGKSFVPSKEIVAPPLIGYMTKTNVNGKTTTFGTNSDIKGIIFGNWSSGYMNMVIYKSIFYTKTISLLEINFLKNLMEKDEIINLNNPIFIQK